MTKSTKETTTTGNAPGKTSAMPGAQTEAGNPTPDLRSAEPTLKDEAAVQAQSAKRAALDAAGEAVEAARSGVEAHADRARAGVSQEVDDAAGSIREAGRAFEPGSMANSAAESLADNLTHAASAVRSADLGSLQADVTEFARRNPLVFFGGAAVLGFMAGRLLKASERAEYEPAEQPETVGERPRAWGYS